MSIKSALRPYYHKVKNLLKFRRRVRLKNKTVSIIANNCGGGFISQYYGLPYNSPTAGLFFETTDYLKLVNNLKHYLSQPLVFIEPSASRYFEKFQPIHYPVARCDDIEIFFMHYPTAQEAEKKWRRRSDRVDLDNVYVLLIENDSTTKELLEQFDDIVYPHKALIFSDYPDLKNTVRNTDVLKNEKHHWKPECVVASCDWKLEFNNIKGK